MKYLINKVFLCISLFFQVMVIFPMEQSITHFEKIEETTSPIEIPLKIGNIQESNQNILLSSDETSLLEQQNFTPEQKSNCQKAILKLKSAGLWTKKMVTKHIFTILALENALICLMVIFDYINTNGDDTQPQITPQWLLAVDSALYLAQMVAINYAQWCKNKLDKLTAKFTKENTNLKSCGQRLWSKVKQSAGYIYCACETAFSIAALVDTFSQDFNMPREAYLVDYIQALFFTTAGTCAAGYYQSQLAKQKQSMQEELSKSLINDDQNNIAETANV